MKLEYKVWNIHKEWQPLLATTVEGATKEIMRKGPAFEEALIRNADTGEVFKQDAPYGRNGGVRCDTADGPCACGAWH